MRSIMSVSSVLLALSACHSAPPAPSSANATPSAQASAETTAHGGVMAESANLRAEVVAQPDGRVLTYVTDPRGAPVRPSTVRVALRRPNGRPQAVPVAYDPASRAYVGRAAAVPPGEYPVEVEVQPTARAAPVQMLTAPVAIASTVRPPPPRHRGQVTVVGDRAVEVAIARSGDVAAFWTTLDGEPVAPAQVESPSLVIHVGDRERAVTLRPSGDALVGHLALAGHTRFVVEIPSVTLDGAVYVGAEAPMVVAVASIPGVIFVEEPVARPTRTVVAYERPAPSVVVFEPMGWGHRGRGRGHYDNGLHLGHGGGGRGHGRGR